MQTHYDVLITGAGPAGATAAILLAQAGWSVAVIEKQPYPRRKVCGECIAATNLSLLDALGIGEKFNTLSGPELRRFALMCGNESIVADLPPLMQGRHRWGRALGREYLDSMLLDRARQAGSSVFQPWSVRRITGGPGAFRGEIRAADSGRAATLTAPVLIAAHGSWEPGPSTSEKKRTLKRAGDLFAFKANFRNTRLAHGLLPVLAFDGGYGGMVVAGNGIMTLACCIRRDSLMSYRSRTDATRIGEIVESCLKQNCTGVSDVLSGARRDGPWLGAGPIRPGIRMPRHGGHAFLVGNAAGEAHPIIGEGISMAMQSAWLLCGYLAAHRKSLVAGSSQARLQYEYADAWRRNFAGRIRLAALFAHVAMRPAMASGLLPLVRRYPELLTWAARLSGKVKRPADDQALQAAMS